MYNPFVFRNLANAQYAQPRGSQYAGPVVSEQPTYVVTSDWDAPCNGECCDTTKAPDCHECGHVFDAPCCCVNDI